MFSQRWCQQLARYDAGVANASRIAMKIAGLLVFCLTVASCGPPYIMELDASAALTRHMIIVGTLGVVSASGGSTLKFLPTKPTASGIGGVSVQSGFLVTDGPGLKSLSFAYTDSNGNLQTTGNQSFSLAGANSNYPLYDFDVTTTTTAATILVFRMDPATPAVSTGTLLTATLPSGPLTTPLPTNGNPEPLTVLFGSSQNVAGVQVLSNPSAADTFNFLNQGISTSPGYTDGRGYLIDGVTNIVTTPGLALATSPLLSAIPLGINRFFYCYDSTTALSYATYCSGGQWLCYQWSTTQSAKLLPGVTHRLDAALSTGDLLSTEGGMLNLYDQNGSPVFSVSLGGLQFCYEAYIGSTAYVFFSLTLGVSHGYAFNIYAIPTSQMRSLGG